MNNYIFVDIDGPLLPGKGFIFPENRKMLNEFNAGAEFIDKYPPRFDEFAVRYHNLLAKYSNAKIVIATAWRSWASIERLQQLFADQGLEFEYAEDPSLSRRGLSSERVHDVATHMEEYLPENSNVLIIDDHPSLRYLETFYRENENGELNDGAKELQEKNIKWKWLEVDYNDGLTYNQFKEGAGFLDVDWGKLKFEEFGIEPITPEEKANRNSGDDLLYSALI